MEVTDTGGLLGNANGTEMKPVPKKPWEKPDYRKIKKKKTPAEKNMRLKKFVQPKNAVMCLNELKSGLEYIVEQESSGIGHPFCISVEIDGQKYRGYGSSKLLARQAAAEAALISFVRPPVSKEGDEEDNTPWASLASFAVYKLFNDWREGKVGMYTAPPQQFGMPAADPEAANYMGAHLQMHSGLVAAPKIQNVPNQNIKMDNEQPKIPKPAKQLPENAAAMHPAMLLHQMRPEVQYSHTQEMREGKPYFYVQGVVDNLTFSGEGPNVKKAKFFMARQANQGLFGVISSYVAN